MNQKRRLKIARRKEMEAWSQSVRARDKVCQICQKSKNLNAHHILSKRLYPEFKLELWNGIALCHFHHKFSRISPHQDPIGFVSFMLIEKPEMFYALIDKVRAKQRLQPVSGRSGAITGEG